MLTFLTSLVIMNIANKIEYIATDEQLLKIP